MRHLFVAIPLLVLATAGCKRSNEPPSAPDQEPIVAPGSTASVAKPASCNDAQDCAERGTTALLAGDPQSVEMLRYSCECDFAPACQNLSAALRSGAVPEDPRLAHAAAVRGCEIGNAPSCVDLGVDESMGYGGATQDFGAAYQHFMSACEAGDGRGCRFAGVLHHEGSLGMADPVAAMQTFDRGCQLADAESCFNAGVLIIEGVIGGAALAGASNYMTRACELGDQDGCAAVDKIAEAMRAQAGKITGSNLRMGSATVNGFTVDSLECRIESGGTGVLGNMAIIAALAERKAAIDKCGKKGTIVEVTWTASGGMITSAEGIGSEGTCVAKVLRKLVTPLDGECVGMIVLGGA